MAGWLGQLDDNGNLQMVLCASKKLNQAQRNYATNKRELYGIIFCLQKFRHYPLGRKFVIRVDHAPLLSMIKDSNNVTFLNWKECLLEFDFELEFFFFFLFLNCKVYFAQKITKKCYKKVLICSSIGS